MKKIMVAVLLLMLRGGISAAEAVVGETPEKMRTEGAGDAVAQAEKAYSIGLICYAGGDLANAERFFAQALQFNPQMYKADHALKQVRMERELAK